MTAGERIAATTSWKTNRSELARLIDSAIEQAIYRAVQFGGDPCPVCGNETHHPTTGLLTCECPAGTK